MQAHTELWQRNLLSLIHVALTCSSVAFSLSFQSTRSEQGEKEGRGAPAWGWGTLLQGAVGTATFTQLQPVGTAGHVLNSFTNPAQQPEEPRWLLATPTAPGAPETQ